MGSIDKYIFRTALASLAPILGGQAGALRIARAPDSVDPMTSQPWMILAFLGFDSRVIPAFAIGQSNARLPRRLGRPVTA